MKTLIRPSRQPKTPMVYTPQFWLGFNLQRIRAAKGLTQEKLAKAAKISIRTLRDVETAAPDNNPELGTIAALANALGVEVPVLFMHDKKAEAEAAEFAV